MLDSDFTPLRGEPDAQGYPTLPPDPAQAHGVRLNRLVCPPRSPFAEPSQAEACHRLGAPQDMRRYREEPLPLWRDITLFIPGRKDSLHQRRDGLARLCRWVANWLGAVMAERGRHPDDPHWEPTRELAAVLGLPEPHLNRLCREHEGLSARDIWDKIRFHELMGNLRTEMAEMLHGRSFTPARKKGGKPDRFAQLQTALRSARREQGWTRLEFAWRMGYSHFARLNLAAFRSQGYSIQALEAAILRKFADTWHFDDTRCVVQREQDPYAAPSVPSPELSSRNEVINQSIDEPINAQETHANKDTSPQPEQPPAPDAALAACEQPSGMTEATAASPQPLDDDAGPQLADPKPPSIITNLSLGNALDSP